MKEKVLPNEFWRDDEWLHNQYQQLAKKYPNRWITVFNKRVISSGEDLGKVERKAVRKAKSIYFPLVFIERGAHVYKD